MEINQWIAVQIRNKNKKLLSQSTIPMNELKMISSMQRTMKLFPITEVSIGSHSFELVCLNEKIYDQLVINAEMKIYMDGVWIKDVDPIIKLNGETIINVECESVKPVKIYTCELCDGTEWRKDNGIFVCTHCGCKYPLEELKKLEKTENKKDSCQQNDLIHEICSDIPVRRAIHNKICLNDCIEIMTQEGIYSVDTLYVQNNTCYLYNLMDHLYVEIDCEYGICKKGLNMDLIPSKQIRVNKQMIAWNIIKIIIFYLQLANKTILFHNESEIEKQCQCLNHELTPYGIEMRVSKEKVRFIMDGKIITLEQALRFTCVEDERYRSKIIQFRVGNG